MPVEGIVQPELLPVSDSLRLRKYDGVHDFALSWYLDPETVWLVDGDRDPYTPELLSKMYAHQDTWPWTTLPSLSVKKRTGPGAPAGQQSPL